MFPGKRTRNMDASDNSRERKMTAMQGTASNTTMEIDVPPELACERFGAVSETGSRSESVDEILTMKERARRSREYARSSSTSIEPESPLVPGAIAVREELPPRQFAAEVSTPSRSHS